MCGKFTAMYSWREVHTFGQPLTVKAPRGSNDDIDTYTPTRILPVIIFDHETRQRRIVGMRWGYPDAKNPYVLKHMHARSETIDEKATFATSFRDGQRGTVVMRTFNEGKKVVGPKGGKKTQQWTIDPQDGVPRGFAFIWREIEIQGTPTICCVMVTVPPSKLIEPITDRMPAILEDEDWSTWLGEDSSTPEDAKSVLKTMEAVNWKIEKETKAKP